MKLTDAPAMLLPALSVHGFRPGDEARWEDFVERCPEATFFHRIGWKAIIEQTLRHRTHYLLAERGNELVGVLPLAEVKSLLFGHALISLPFAAYAGVAATDEMASDALHTAAVRLASDLGVQHLELRNTRCRMADWPRQDLYVTFRKQILPDPEANMLAIPRKQRAMVRKGLQRGMRTEIDAGVGRFFDLYADNVHRHGTPPLPRKYFEAIAATFGAACETQIIVGPSGKPVSGVMSFYFRDEVLPYFAGDAPEARDLAANDFKYWELMRRARERGCKVFDYGRSKRETGSFSFKKNWGFEPTQLHYEFKLLRRAAIPQNNPSNPKFRMFIALWRALPLGVANAIGPSIVRNLG